MNIDELENIIVAKTSKNGEITDHKILILIRCQDKYQIFII